MEHLSISLLGSIVVEVGQQPASGFKSDKVRALLAYLAAEADRPHRRETLAGLLWPDYPDRAAFNNLRDALANLRTVIHDRDSQPPLLLISTDAIQFNTHSHASVDVWDLEALVAREGNPAAPDLQQAADLARGHFLEGFSVKDSAPFEEWVVVTRDRLNRQMWAILSSLAAFSEQHADYKQAIACVRKQLQIDPLQEQSHQQLMRLLALSGQRSAALAQYDICRRLLADELGVKPERKTTETYQSIRDGTLQPPATQSIEDKSHVAALKQPLLSAATAGAPLASPAPIVAREHELARLGRFLDLSLAGHGQVVFVTGETGAGKSTLVSEFVRQAMQGNDDVLVAEGRCNAYTGAGDPYLPFAEVLQMLTGDIEARRAAGNVSPDHARRLWSAFPVVLEALVDLAPACLDLLVPGETLATKARAFVPGGAPWLGRLETLVQRRNTQPPPGDLHHADMFGQYTALLQAIARQVPLILVLDDLQWADTGTIGLLFHVGRRLAGSRIMIVGAYRPNDVALGQDDGRHPLESVIHELQRDLGDIVVDLDKADGRRFVAAILDSEPNLFSTTFRETLYRHTSGQPLFTVELLRGLREQGELAQDEAGRWVEGGTLNWDHLPPRAEAVIAERVGRLSLRWRSLLTAACVEGEEFIAEVVARVQGEDEAEVIRGLSSTLTAHKIVCASSLHRVGGRRLTRFRFSHYLVQQYLYNHLNDVERIRLHEATGNALEAIYGEQQVADASVELAWHFESAELPEKAVPYLLLAGERAVRLSALPEALAHFTHGLDLLGKLADTSERTRLELALQLGLCVPLHVSGTSASPEHRRAALRAFTLSRQVGTTRQVIQAAYAVWSYFNNRAEYHRALESAQHILDLAGAEGDPLLAALGHAALGYTLQFLGDLNGSYRHLEQVLVHTDQRDYQDVVAITGWNLEVACLARFALVLQAMGYPDQALRCCERALQLAADLNHAYSQAEALASAAVLRALRGDVERTREHVESLRILAEQKRFPLYQAWAAFVGAWQHLQRGEAERAVADLRATETAFDAFGCETHRPLLFMWQSVAGERNGNVKDGLRRLNKALVCINRTGASFFEPEAWRLRGELLIRQGALLNPSPAMSDLLLPGSHPVSERNGNGAGRHDPAAQLVADDLSARGDQLLAPTDAEGCFRKAMAVAQVQQAKMWELRAAVSLARLWQAEGRTLEARQTLEDAYGWFDEGFATPDLQQAASLLTQLSLSAELVRAS